MIVLLGFLTIYSLCHESIPKGETGEVAERLADKMLESMNHEVYKGLELIEWTFRGQHKLRWYKMKDEVIVMWDNYEVLLNLGSLNGSAVMNTVPLEGKELDVALKLAWDYFANDSFWLVAPYKIRDPGTIREYLLIGDNEALKVTYQTGGVTPGDTYIWILDESYKPIAWKMWVSTIPIGGLEFSWENWYQHDGIQFAQNHIGPFGTNVEITEIHVE